MPEEIENGPIYAYGVALTKTLMEDAGVMELAPGGVFDGLKPQRVQAATPYIVLEAYDEIPGDQLTRQASTIMVTMTVDIFSETSTPLVKLSGRIKALLNQQTQPLASNCPSGWTIWRSRQSGGRIFTLDDGIHRMVLRFEANLQKCRER
jgi:hypothetical protein